MMELRQLRALLRLEPFTAIERMLVNDLHDEWKEENPWVLLSVAVCSLAVREGHAFLDLSRKPSFLNELVSEPWPSLNEWNRELASSPIVSPDGAISGRPLILADGRSLYLEKYYTYEKSLATTLIERLPESQVKRETDLAMRAAEQSFFVITGGPGTGKTTLALRYLDAFLGNWKLGRKPRLAAIAPTGKAAARLQESIASGLQRLELEEERRAELSRVPCLTIHRLLGSLPFRTRFRHDRKKPVPYDVVIVDESSMIDLPLMLRLFDALPANCQVLMLGDRDQLSSVEVGSVFSDILEAADSGNERLASSVERLTKTYRFSEDSSIYRLCEAAREGNTTTFSELLNGKHDDWEFNPLPASQSKLPPRIVSSGVERWQKLTGCHSAEEAMNLLANQIILTPTKTGAFGSREINRQILSRIQRLEHQTVDTDTLVHGTPIIVLENNYETELFNGDLGLLWREPGGDEFVYFPAVEGAARRIRLGELPLHAPAFALTIHKSQGSEFDETICLFEPGARNHLSRELVYTAFSRAKQRLVVFGNDKHLADAVGRRVSRATRLASLLSSAKSDNKGTR